MINKKVSVISKIFLCIILIVVIYFIGMTAYLIISLRNCSKAIDNAMKLRDGGDFYYKKYAQSVELCDLTDIGQTKEIIVIPSKIDGLPVKRFGKNGILSSYSESFHSDVLKRIYFPDMIIDMHTLSGCTKLEKVFFLKGIDENMANTHNNSSESIEIYINSRIYNPKTYNVNLYAEGDVNMFFANVSYMQNYEDLRSNGYYWIDDYDYGSKIEFIPENPKREGYTFGGWYREPECVNKWDFETDTLPEEVVVDDVVQYQETRLYAKWS